MRRVAAIAVVAVCLSVSVALAQTLPRSTPLDAWMPTGGVLSTARQGDLLYVGGFFRYVGPTTGSFSWFDAATGAPLGRADATAGEWLAAMVALPDGGWLVSSELANTTARVDAAGRIDASWAASVPTFEQGAADGTTVYLARGGEVAAYELASGAPRWKLDFAAALGTPRVSHLTLLGTMLLVQGNIDYSGGALLPVRRFAAVDAAAGALTVFDLGAMTSVSGLAQGADTLYVSGSPSGLAITLSTGQPRTWDPPPATVKLVATPSTVFAFVAGGTSGGATGLYDLVPLSPATGHPLSAPLVRNGWNAMAASGERLFVSTQTYDDNGFLVSEDVLTFDLSSKRQLAPTFPSDGEVTQLHVSNGRLAVAGRFRSIGGAARASLFALNLRSGILTGFAPALNGQVHAVAVLGSVVVAGGEFTVVNGQPQVGLAAFDSASGALLPWAPLQSGTVNALANDGASLFIGGSFSTIDGLSRPNLAAFIVATGTLTSWVPAPNGVVRALQVTGNALLVGGDFEALAGVARNRVAVFSLQTGTPVATAFSATALRDSVLCVSETGGVILTFSKRQFAGSGTVQAFDPAGHELPLGALLPPYPTFAASGATAADGVLYVSGTLQRPPYLAILAVSTRTGALLDWTVPVNADYIARYPDLLVASGTISAGGYGFPRASLFDVPGAGAPVRLAARVTGNTISLAWAAPAGSTPASYVLEVGSYLGGRNLGRFDVGSGLVATIPSGTYYMRARSVVSGRPGEASSELVVTAPATANPPDAPASLVVAASGAVVTLAWQASRGNAVSYVIEAGTAPGLSDVGALDTGTLDTSFAAFVPAGTYHVRVRARNAFGTSTPSNERVIVVP